MELIRNYRQGKLTTNDVRKLNYIIICIMISVAAISIAWSLSMHVLSGDFYNGFIGAKLVFRERDLTQMENVERNIWKQDLDRILNQTFNIEPLDKIKTGALIMPKLTENQPTTPKPKSIKIYHVFQTTNLKVPDSPIISNSKDNDGNANHETTTKVPKIFNIEEDRKFLSKMTIDVHQTRWHQSAAIKFIYSFPFFSEIIAIIWSAMCFIFQSGVKKTWALPKPWRIVVPSILMFTIMTVSNIIYFVLASNFLKTFCNDLRANLSKPEAISCGDAMAVLRPIIRLQALTHNTYLILFRISYTLAMILWILALLIMLMRFFSAIDFQLVDVETSYEMEAQFKEKEFVEVQLNSPQHVVSAANLNFNIEQQKPEDDFQSAKSHLSEVATPLLDQVRPTREATKT